MGLVAAYLAASRGHRGVVLEKEGRVGGLLRTECVEDYCFDAGGSHIVFSRKRELLEFLINAAGGRTQVIEHVRDTRIYYRGIYLRYPFENGIYMLSPEERLAILRSVVEAYIARATGAASKPKSFLEWIVAVFGREIAERYLVPYNEKLWKRPLDMVTTEWIGGRVPNPPIEDVMRSAVGLPTHGYKHQLVFYYPAKGGIESLARGLESMVVRAGGSIRVSCPVKKIEPCGESCVAVDSACGSESFNLVINTAPLPELVKLLPRRLRSDLEPLASSLDYNSLYVIGVGGIGTGVPYHWVYIPQREIPFHRIGILSNYSPSMAPRGRVSIIAEVSVNPREGLRMGEQSLARATVEALEDMGLLKRGGAEVVEVWRWSYAYVVYTRGVSLAAERIVEELRALGIVSTGRFGSWSYLNMDGVIDRVRMDMEVVLGGATS